MNTMTIWRIDYWHKVSTSAVGWSLSLLAEVSHNEAKMPRRERPLLAGKWSLCTIRKKIKTVGFKACYTNSKWKPKRFNQRGGLSNYCPTSKTRWNGSDKNDERPDLLVNIILSPSQSARGMISKRLYARNRLLNFVHWTNISLSR